MRKVLLTFMTTVAAVVAMFGYRTSTPHPVSVATPSVAAAGGADSAHSAGTTPAAPTSRVVTGPAVSTRWGPVQVAITVAGRTITAADAVVVPSENRRDVEINARAIPVLTEETVKAQGAGIDAVSGATVTSGGYVTSLQAALDAAGL